jgi:hypothetical protein
MSFETKYNILYFTFVTRIIFIKIKTPYTIFNSILCNMPADTSTKCI